MTFIIILFKYLHPLIIPDHLIELLNFFAEVWMITEELFVAHALNSLLQVLATLLTWVHAPEDLPGDAEENVLVVGQ